jgi:carbamoyltransferase
MVVVMDASMRDKSTQSYVAFAPKGIKSFLAAMPVWLKEKMLLKNVLQEELIGLDGVKVRSALPPVLFGEHHESHAASAFYPSPFKSAAVLCMDGVGEWATTSAWLGEGKDLTPFGRSNSHIRLAYFIRRLRITRDFGSTQASTR